MAVQTRILRGGVNVSNGEGNACTVTANYYKTPRQGNYIEEKGIKGLNYRIRKLTPRECFRLMGVSETDIDKIQAAGISNTRQYQLAGNSIVVDVLEHLMRKLLVDRTL